MKKNSLGLVSILVSAVLLVVVLGLYQKQSSLEANSTTLGNGIVTRAKLSGDLKAQLASDLQLVGALPTNSDGSLGSCQTGQLLTFSNGKLICATVSTASGVPLLVTPVPSTTGASGNNGSAGSSGTAGTNGTAGTSTNGTNGQAGTDGNAGVSGSNGTNGTTGTSSNGQAGVNGSQGPQGSAGATGAQGSQGPQGIQGSPGVLSTTTGDGLSASVASQVLSMNIVTDPNGGLATSGNGLSLLASCSANQILKWNGTAWICAADNIGTVTAADLTSSTPGISVVGGTGAVLGNGASIDIATASATQSGLLDSADWTTFSNKENGLTFAGNGLFSRTGNTITATTCTANQFSVYNGSIWICTDQPSIPTYTAGVGINKTGTVFSLDPSSLASVSSVAGSDQVLIYDGSTTKRISYDNLFGGVLGSLNYRGSWNASTDVPTLASTCSASTKGYYYVVNTAGATNLDGVSTWSLGDWAVCNGTAWQRVQTTNGVASVFGRTGSVSAQAGDYTASQITNTPAGNIASTTVQGALNGLDTSKLSNSLASGLVFVGDSAGQASGVALSGDATLSNSGVVTLADNSVTSAKIADGTITFADLASNSCSNGQTIVSNGSTWSCGAGGTTYTASTTGGNTNQPIAVSGSTIGLSDGTATGQTWVWDGTKWTLAIPGNSLSIGAIDSQTKSANGAVIAGNSLFLQSADASNPGLVTTGTQTIAGDKTLTGNTTLGSGTSSALTINGKYVGLPNGVQMVGGAGQSLAFQASGGGALSLDTDASGTISIGTGANSKSIIIGNSSGTTLLSFATGNNGMSFTSGAQGNVNAFTYSATGVTTGDVQRIVADALTSGTAFKLISNSANFTGNLASFGLGQGSAANTGTIVNIDSGAPGNSNVLPLNINRATAGQLVGYNNGTATTGYYNGIGSPEGVVTANVGSTYSATDTGSMYVKTSNNGGNTGWTVLGAGVAASYMQAGLSNDQASNTSNNDHIKYDTNVNSTGSDIALNTTSPYTNSANANSLGRFTLKAGKTYQLTATMGPVKAANTDGITMGWFNSDTGQALGANTQLVPSNAAGQFSGGSVATAIYTANADTRVEFKIIHASAPINTIYGTQGFGAPQSNAVISVIGGNAPVVGQTVDLISAKLSSDLGNVTNGKDITWNTKTNGNMTLGAGGTFNLLAGKTYSLDADLRFYGGNSYLGYDWVDATTNLPLQTGGGSAGFVQAPNVSGNESGYTPSRLYYTPTANQTVKVRVVSSGGPAVTVQSNYSHATVTQVGTTASTGIAMNFIADALANGSLDNRGYTQTWNWSTVGANNGLVINSTDPTASGSLVKISSAASTGNAMNISADGLTSGNGLNVASASTSLTGSLVNVSLTGNNAGNTGSLMTLSSTGASSSVSGLRINVVGNGLALDVSGGVAFRAGTTYTATGTQNNVNFGNASNYRLNPASALTLTGMTGGADGKLLTLANVSSTTVTLANQNTGSSAANRIITGSGSDLTLASNQSALLQYDVTSSVWRIVSTSITPPAAATRAYGSTAPVTNYTFTSSVGVAVPGMSVTLPNVGTYQITYNIGFQLPYINNVSTDCLGTYMQGPVAAAPGSHAFACILGTNPYGQTTQTFQVTTTAPNAVYTLMGKDYDYSSPYGITIGNEGAGVDTKINFNQL